MVDGVDGIEVIRAFGNEPYERRRFTEASSRLNRLLVRLGSLSGAVYPIYEVLAAAILVGVLLTTTGTPADLPPLLVFVFLFSGWSYQMPAGAPRWLGMVAPLGGVSFMVAWALLARHALSAPSPAAAGEGRGEGS